MDNSASEMKAYADNTSSFNTFNKNQRSAELVGSELVAEIDPRQQMNFTKKIEAVQEDDQGEDK